MPETASHPSDRAIVIGASMAGLITARVLAEGFREVVLMEKDVFPAPGENRRSVPQDRHIHVLLERGRRVMERYLPGLTDELLGLGACDIGDAGREVSWFHVGPFEPGASGVRGIGVSRPTLETSVRSRVLAHERVRALEDTRVLGLEGGKERVTGVRFTRTNSDDGETMRADLVVDASGRGSRGPAWLEELGYGRPEDEEVRVDLGYATCFYPHRPDDLPGLKGVYFMATPSRPRLGVIIGQDHDRWVVTLGGYLGYHASTDYDRFLAFARDLPTPQIYDVIKDRDPLTKPVAYRYSANLRRHYERLSRLPKGYVVVGDALCSLNPVYGQGMTIAALEADALGACMARGPRRLARRYFARVRKVVDLAWSVTVRNDLSFPGVQGRRTTATRLTNWYMGHVHRAACDDAEVGAAFLRVVNMLAPPSSILNPRIVGRVLRSRMSTGRR